MAVLSAQQITEVNTLIAEIQKSIKPKCEIGAHDKVILNGLLKANKVKGKPQFYKCKRELSDAIVSYFVKEKGVIKNRFHMNHQPYIFIIK